MSRFESSGRGDGGHLCPTSQQSCDGFSNRTRFVGRRPRANLPLLEKAARRLAQARAIRPHQVRGRDQQRDGSQMHPELLPGTQEAAGAGEETASVLSEQRCLMSSGWVHGCPRATSPLPCHHHRPIVQIPKLSTGTAPNPGPRRTARVWQRRDSKPGLQARVSRGSWSPTADTLRRPPWDPPQGPPCPLRTPAITVTRQCIFDFRLMSFVWVSHHSKWNATYRIRQWLHRIAENRAPPAKSEQSFLVSPPLQLWTLQQGQTHLKK